MRTLVETLEPVVHAFTPEIQSPTRTAALGAPLFWPCLGALLTVPARFNVERSPWYPKGLNPDRVARKEPVPFYSGTGDNLFCDQRGSSRWAPPLVATDYMDTVLVPDDLLEAFRAHKVRNLSFYQQGLV